MPKPSNKDKPPYNLEEKKIKAKGIKKRNKSELHPTQPAIKNMSQRRKPHVATVKCTFKKRT
jgi:hypothetical protein